MSRHQVGLYFFGTIFIIYLVGIFVLHWFVFPLLILTVFYLGIIAYGSFKISSNYHLSATCQVKTEEKIVAITFDDGPSEFTNRALELLKKYEFKATFFCIGKNIEKYKPILKDIHQEGHSIGNHSYSHAKIGFQSSSEVFEELQKTDRLINEIVGIRPQYYRPPFGVTNPNIRKAVRQSEHQVIGWNIRSLDTAIHNENKILDRILVRLKPGSIILLHDTSEKSLLVLEQLLSYLKKNNWKSVSIQELLSL